MAYPTRKPTGPKILTDPGQGRTHTKRPLALLQQTYWARSSFCHGLVGGCMKVIWSGVEISCFLSLMSLFSGILHDTPLPGHHCGLRTKHLTATHGLPRCTWMHIHPANYHRQNASPQAKCLDQAPTQNPPQWPSLPGSPPSPKISQTQPRVGNTLKTLWPSGSRHTGHAHPFAMVWLLAA